MSEEYFGEGQYGCIIRNDENFVFKYGLIYDIKLEYKNIKLLPIINNFYVNPLEIEIIDVGLDEQDKIINLCPLLYQELRQEPKNHIFLKKIKMPYIKGMTLYNYLEKIKNTKFSRKEWKNMIKSFIILFLDIIEFNSQGFYHNDLHFDNIMYDYDTEININNFDDLKKNQYKTMKIIDFGTLTLNYPNYKLGSETDEDQNVMLYNLKYLIKIGTNNKKIFNFLLGNGIIDKNKIITINDSNLYDYYLFELLNDL